MKRTRTVSGSIAKTFLFFAFACISTVWAAEGDSPLKVPYLDEKGETQYCENPVELNNDTDISDTLPGGCYVVTGKVSYTSQLIFKDTTDKKDGIHLILADEAELSVENPEAHNAILVSGNMTISAQSTGEKMGKLTATANTDTNRIVHVLYYKDSLTINGGNITAAGDYGLSTKKLTINDGKLTVIAKESALYAGTAIINGGSVTATGKHEGFGSYNITINNGNVIAVAEAEDDGRGAGFSTYEAIINGGHLTTKGGFRSINASTITINGGRVNAEGELYGIFTGDLYVNGGDITAIAKGSKRIREHMGSYAERDIEINGGRVTSTGAYGFHAKGHIVIHGGNVTVTGEEASIRVGPVNLGYSSATDSIYIGSFYKSGLYHYSVSVEVAEGQVLTDGEGNSYTGILTDEEISAISGKTLRPAYAISFVSNDINVVIPRQAVLIGETLTEPTVSRDGFELDGWYTDKNFTIRFDFSKPPKQNETLYAKWKNPVKVAYIDEKGKTQQQSEYYYLKSTTDVSDSLPGGWYIIKGRMIDSVQLKFKGDVHLILADSAKLSIEPFGIYVNGNLTIYAQSTGYQKGELFADRFTIKKSITINGGYVSGNSGFYVDDDIIINDGSIIAKSVRYSENHALYAKNNITINGGSITAYSQNGSTNTYSDGAIYAENGDITINDGSVTADGKGHMGIITWHGNITINGGTISSKGSDGGIQTGDGNITINGGSITVNGDNSNVGIFTVGRDGIYAENGDIIINGGYVNASCRYGSSITAYGNLIINGGSVIAAPNSRLLLHGLWAEHGDIILGYCSATDSIVSYDYYAPEGKVYVAKDLAFKDSRDSIYSDTLTEKLSNIKKIVLKPAYASTSCGAKDGFVPVVTHTPKIAYANGQLTIIVPRTTNVKVEIFDLMGNLVKKSFGNTETHTVSLNHLKRGAYVARVTANHAVRALRFQVN